ncbi:AraC family transcriptional regulator ligand-binding domain-containing protein [Rhizobacter sp. P5_C2]
MHLVTPPLPRPDRFAARTTPDRVPDRVNLPAAFWSGVRAVGLTQSQVIAESRLPLSALDGSRVVVSTDQLFDVWRAISALHPAPDVGLRFVRGMDTLQAHPIVLAAMQARSLREALASLARYKQLCGGEVLRLNPSGADTAIEPEWPFATTSPPAALVDATFASIIELGRRGTGTHLRPRRLALRCRRDGEEARSSYFGVSIEFGASCNALVLGSADLDLPFTMHNAELTDMLAPGLERHLADLHAVASTAHQVKQIVKRRLSASPVSVGSVAKDLGTSVRTLQRRITAEGTSFRRILDEARQELVRQYLADPEIGISEAAFLLGYQDANSFYRAFRSWEGTTPAHWRDARGTSH